MGNVFDAMKRHQQEQAQKPPIVAEESVDGSAEAAEPAAPATLAGIVGKHQEAAQAVATAEPPMASPIANKPAARPRTGLLQSPNDGGRFSPSLVAHHDRGGAVTEEYRTLRTSLLAQCTDERFCFMITSASPGEGKTVTSLNLALVMAERTDMKTIVVDCDLRKRTVAQLLGCSQTPGVAELLQGTAKLEEIIKSTCYPNLHVIPAGDAYFDRVGEITINRELEEMVSDLRKRYDYVIFDAPPINGLSDAGMLGRNVGEALLVVQLNRTRKESVEKAIRLLHAANVEVRGMVLTHRKYLIPSYIYRYA